jgi:SAM-dependent methyltransferase
MGNPMKISDQAFAYLKIQRGGIFEKAGDRATWERAYWDQIGEQVRSILPHVPGVDSAPTVLDVGSGLGGFGIAFSRELPLSRFTLLDGVADRAECRLHRQTFNDMQVALEYWGDNDQRPHSYIDAKTLCERRFDRHIPEPEPDLFDLVVSFGSYAFHYPPEAYLDLIRSRLAPHGRVCLEVRNGKPGWWATLAAAFGEPVALTTSRKYTRLLYGAS